jgi:large subunit ribosomal protein L9
VGTSDIADAVIAVGGEVQKSEIRLPEGPLRELGEYEIDVHLHGDIDVKILVRIVLEETDPPS